MSNEKNYYSGDGWAMCRAFIIKPDTRRATNNRADKFSRIKSYCPDAIKACWGKSWHQKLKRKLILKG